MPPPPGAPPGGPGARRHRPSIQGNNGNGPTGLEDISHLSLTEVRERLKRNERVLGTAAFSPRSPSIASTSPAPGAAGAASGAAGGSGPGQSSSPTIPRGNSISLGTSPTSPILQSPPAFQPGSFGSTSGGGGNGILFWGRQRTSISGGAFGSSPGTGGTTTDPVRDRLLAVREQLLAREKELCDQGEGIKLEGGEGEGGGDISVMGMGMGMGMGTGVDMDMEGIENQGESSRTGAQMMMQSGLKRGEDGVISAVRAGKGGRGRALEAMTAGDQRLAKNGVLLPMTETLALGRRDFDDATARQLSALSILPKSSRSSTDSTPTGTPPRNRMRRQQRRRGDLDTDGNLICSSSTSKSSSPVPRFARLAPDSDLPSSSSLGPRPSSGRGSTRTATATATGGVGGGGGRGAGRAGYDPNDEIARAQATARMRAFMSYKPSRDDFDYAGSDDGDYEGDDLAGAIWDTEMDAEGAGEGEYDGDGDRFALEAQGREPHRFERGTKEEVDEFGEDDEDWAEGNDDYLDRVR